MLMKCERVPESILFYVYGEMEDGARQELEQHLALCTECAAELQRIREFQAALPALSAGEPSPNFLDASRIKLQESLNRAKPAGLWRRLFYNPATRFGFSPALAAVIFVIGFAGGAGVTYRRAAGQAPAEPVIAESPVQTSPVSGIQSISQEPASNQISIRYDTVSTQQTQGPINDERIQQLLLFAARNTYNSGVRLDSVDLLTQNPEGSNVRETLMYALRYDSNAAVRVKALSALKPYVKQDIRVRNTVLEALLNDSDPEIRAEALRSVQPVRADTNVRAVLHRLAQTDESKNIRSQARTELAEVPEID
jgi:anti-sigma factor RsiW